MQQPELERGGTVRHLCCGRFEELDRFVIVPGTSGEVTEYRGGVDIAGGTAARPRFRVCKLAMRNRRPRTGGKRLRSSSRLLRGWT